MKPQDDSRSDDRLRRLFGELRRHEETRVPPFVRLRWLRPDPESRRTMIRRWILASVAGSVVTVCLAALTVVWRYPGFAGPQTEKQDTSRAIAVRKYTPPPPRVERKQIVQRRITRKSSSSLPTPDMPEPVQEYEQELRRAEEEALRKMAAERRRPEKRHQDSSLDKLSTLGYVDHSANGSPPLDASIVLGLPEPPPPSGPKLPGIGDVSKPVLIESTKVEPRYPELARQARLEGRVILQAVVRSTGEVDDVQVLRTDRPDLGFEQAAIEAVQQWRYRPAVHNGRPVDVYMTINVDFDAGKISRITQGGSIPPMNTESYAAFDDNPFHAVADEPLSTFSADVDTASYSNVRRFLNHGGIPHRDAVRVEELINYFDYGHPVPEGDDPFGVDIEIADCPWNMQHRLARLTLAARQDAPETLAGRNLVFLLDVSGSMKSHNKLPLVQKSMRMLAGQLGHDDIVSIVVYAGSSGLALPPTAGSDTHTIIDAINRLRAGGSTAGAAGLNLAYRIARENFIEGGVNRVVLATDGDFNVGVTSHSELLRIIEEDARNGIFLSALGFGMGNYKDDRLEQLADRGNGNYAYIDTEAEARKALVEELAGTLVTVAKDVKFQVEFNPLEVGAYRLIGYENRILAHRDFNDDTKDAGEVGAGHTVTVLYELVPPGKVGRLVEVDSLRYQRSTVTTESAAAGEMFTLKIRFKRPDEHVSSLRTYRVTDHGMSLSASSDDFRFAAAVASFGMRLRQSYVVEDYGWHRIRGDAVGAVGHDRFGHRRAFLALVDKAGRLAP